MLEILGGGHEAAGGVHKAGGFGAHGLLIGIRGEGAVGLGRVTMRRASTRKPNATTSVNAAARSSATAKSPTKAPERIESANRTMSSSLGA